MATGFTVSSLTDYVNEQSRELLTALQFENETASYANIQPGVKSSAALQILTSTPIPQDGSTCAFNASGGTTFTQRILSTSAVKYQDTLCFRTLEAKWTQLLLKRGQKYDESNVPAAMVADLVAQIKAQQETADWQGDTTSTSAYLSRYDGLIKIIAAASGTNVATASTWNASNARAIVKNIISKIPAALKGSPSVKIFMGYDAAETYRQALMDANLFHVPAGSGNQQGIMAEGSVHEVVPVHGLDGLTASSGTSAPFIFALDPDRNLYLGVDSPDEEDQAEMWYSQDDQNVKYSFRFRRGWQIAFPSEIVEYANS
jgi:hypothetical protein